MCKTYTVKQQLSKFGRWATPVEDLLDETPPPEIIRPTLLGPVLLADGTARMMSWGFRRMLGGQGLTAINNARTEKLLDWPWERAMREGRKCLLPISAWFDFRGPANRKEPMEFRSPSGGWLWAAGLWENSPTFGECYTMLMTDPNAFMAGYYDRMPALLTEEEGLAFLGGERMEFRPALIPLEMVTPAFHPITGKSVPPPQRDLFG